MLAISNVLVFILLLAGIILLHIFLSTRENKWLGLTFPAVSFLFSIMAVLGYAVYKSQTAFEIFIQVTMIFLLSNIPTLILIAIYLACRQRFKKKKEIDKMNIQDLE